MNQAISEVLPFAIGIAISPIPLVAVIVVLFSPRAKANGLAFLLGWVVGLAALATGVYLVADALGVGSDDTASDSTSTLRVVLGAALIVVGMRRWRSRPVGDAGASLPKWMSGVEAFTPGKAAVLGAAAGAVNPKNLILALGAATGLASLNPTCGDAAVGLVAFVVVASSIVTLVVASRWVGGERARLRLDELKAWLTTHNDAVMAVLFLVFGVFLVAEGLGRL